MTCETCREQILPYLYELLESQERQQLTAHLETCPGCQDALKAAQEQIGMLAEAVKPVHADIVFKAPAKATPASTAPTLVLAPVPRRFFLLNRWAMAASILLVLFSFGGVIGGTIWRDHADSLAAAQERLAKARLDLEGVQSELHEKKDQTQKEIRAIQEQIDEVFNHWKKEESTARKMLEKQRVQLIIKGPRVAQAGAPNRYDVEMSQESVDNFQQNAKGQQNKNQQLPGNMPPLNARVVNQKTQEVLYQKQLQLMQNKANFDLPAELPIKPSDDLAIEFETMDAEGKAVNLRDNLKLVFPEYVTHLAADRPMYRPGETVRFRSLTLERFSLKPPAQDFHLRYRIANPRNEEIYAKEYASQVVAAKDMSLIKGPDGRPLRGLGAGEFTLPPELPEGFYTLTVSELNERFNEEKRSFQVRRWQTPRFNKEVTFHRSSYGPGDQVKIQVRATPVQGELPGGRNNIQVNVQLKVDGNPLPEQNRNTDDGRTEFEFNLPGQIFKGVGTVIVRCDDGGGPETTVRNLPIVLRDLSVDFYPEGGELIAGLPNRVYFQARTPAGKPADLEGVILDPQKREVARIQTLTDDREPGINQGLGSFVFTPQAKKRYSLRIESPMGIDRQFSLPIVRDDGVVLSIPQSVVDNEINVNLQTGKTARDLLVGAYCRGRMLDHKFVKANPNQPTAVTLKPQVQIGGVYRITVFEKLRSADGIFYQPLAERLVYRKSQTHVDVAIENDKAWQQPGEPVELRFTARNEKREFVPAVAMVAVVDGSVGKLANDKTVRTMPTHFLLTTEVRNPEDLENADVLLGSHAKAGIALDLLLGSQGWRRFAEQDPKVFAQRSQQARAPVFVANSISVPQFLETEKRQIDKMDQAFVAKAIALNKKLAEKEKEDAGPVELQQSVQQVQAEVQATQNRVDEVQRRMREIRGFLFQFGLGGILLTLLFIAFFLVSVGLRRLAEGGHARTFLFLGLALLSLLFLASIIGTFTLMGEPLFDDMRFQDRRGVMFSAVGPAPAIAVAPGWLPADLQGEAASDEFAALDEIEPKALAVGGTKKGVFAAPAFEQQRFLNNQEDPRNLQGWPGQGNAAPQPPQPMPIVLEDRLLRQQGNYQELLERQLGRRVQLPPAHDPCLVREYAHKHMADKDAVRRDFTETIYWHPVLVMPEGKAQVKFDLSDSVTRYEVLVLSHTFDGRIGASRAEITAKLPFSVEPKTPFEVTGTDQIGIPVTVSNEMPREISASLQARVKGLKLQGQPDRALILKANETRRELFRATPSIAEGDAAFRIVGKSNGPSDSVERKFKVVPDGFPVTGSLSGIIENAPVELPIDLPAQWINGSLQVQAHFYPSPLAELQNGLEALLREPVGCFEQSSSSNYPNVLILNYMLQRHSRENLGFNPGLLPNPLLEKRARQLSQAGYQKLTAFECIDPNDPTVRRGYEWFGGAVPPHEALTAYALLQFRDMAKVHRVDQAMLQRTEQYLLDQRDGKGGFKRNPKGLDQFGRAPDAVTNAYIVWSLTESGTTENLDAELTALREAAKVRKDPYYLALVALSHLNRKKTAEGLELLRQVGAFQDKDGQVAGATTSITGSQGRDLGVETTSLAILGWLKAERPGDFHPNLQSAFKWLGQQRRGQGSYGGTQATVLALKAMVAHAQKHPRNLQNGEVLLTLRGTFPGDVLGQPVQFKDGFGTPAVADTNRATISPRMQDPINLKLRESDALRPGRNLVQLNVTGGSTLPYTLTWSFRTLKPANDAKAPVKLQTSLGAEQAKEGQTVKLTAVIENVSGKGQGMTVAIVGLPAGLSIPEDANQLKALARLQEGGTKPGKISSWELRGRELVLYWRDLAPEAKVEVELDLICRLPGHYRGPASRAYPYYDADRKFWVDPLSIRIDE